MSLSPITPPRRPPVRPKIGAFTRFIVIPLLILFAGVRLGMLWQKHLTPAPAPAPVYPVNVDPLPVSAPPPPSPSPRRPTVEVSGSFQNNLYPSLILSFGTAYPTYARCLAFRVYGATPSATLQVKVDSELFTQPLVIAPPTGAVNFALSPDLPWNYDALRAIGQDRPESFVVTLLDGERAIAQQSVVCIVHAVNQVVTRVINPDTNQWQDTSVCIAAFVNEDSAEIPTILREAMARGKIDGFTGYEFGVPAVTAQVHAIWDALAARGLNYVNVSTMSSATPGITTQSVRFVEQSLHDQGANCVDASVLFAAILRKIGLRPVLVFKPGHCLVAVYDAAQGGQLLSIETTLLNSGSFSNAVTVGGEEFQASAPYFGQPDYSSVDIAFARQQGIVPIAAPVTTTP